MASIEQKLKPFAVPNFVIAEIPPGSRSDGMKEAPCYSLREVPEAVLMEMCDDFRAAVLAKHREPKPVMRAPHPRDIQRSQT